MAGATILSRRPPRSTAKRRVLAKYPLAQCKFTPNGCKCRVVPTMRDRSAYVAFAETPAKAWELMEEMLTLRRML
jgi:hypothetical protein